MTICKICKSASLRTTCSTYPRWWTSTYKLGVSTCRLVTSFLPHSVIRTYKVFKMHVSFNSATSWSVAMLVKSSWMHGKASLQNLAY